MKRVLGNLILLFGLVSCQFSTGPSAGVGPVQVGLHVNSDGEFEAETTISIPIVADKDLGAGINWDFTFSTVLNEAEDKGNYLIVMWEENGSIKEKDFPIGQPFEINFEHDQWVRKIKRLDNGSIVVFVEKQELLQREAVEQQANVSGINEPPPTAAVEMLRIYDFQACVNPCNGSNSQTTFPANTTSIHIAWKYENIPTGAHFVRYWTHETKGLWMTYDCSWDRSSSGEVSTRFYDNGGLAAGKWTVTMEVNGEVALQESLTIKGSENYWDPWPPIMKCFSN